MLKSEIKEVVSFPCLQISGSQIWLHIHFICLRLYPRNCDRVILRAGREWYPYRALLYGLSHYNCGWGAGREGPLDALSLLKRPDQTNLEMCYLLHCMALSGVQYVLSSQPCRGGKARYLSPFCRWENWRPKRLAKGQKQIWNCKQSLSESFSPAL